MGPSGRPRALRGRRAPGCHSGFGPGPPVHGSAASRPPWERTVGASQFVFGNGRPRPRGGSDRGTRPRGSGDGAGTSAGGAGVGAAWPGRGMGGLAVGVRGLAHRPPNPATPHGRGAGRRSHGTPPLPLAGSGETAAHRATATPTALADTALRRLPCGLPGSMAGGGGSRPPGDSVPPVGLLARPRRQGHPRAAAPMSPALIRAFLSSCSPSGLRPCGRGGRTGRPAAVRCAGGPSSQGPPVPGAR